MFDIIFNLEELKILRFCVQNQIDITNLYFKKMKKKKNNIYNSKDEQIAYLNGLVSKLDSFILSLDGDVK